MLQELAVTKVYKSDKDKQGNLLKDRNGNTYTKVAIKVDYADYDGKWLSHLVYRDNDKALLVEENKRYKLKITSNGDFINFDIPSRTDLLEERIQRLERWVEQMNESLLAAKASGQKTISKADLPPAPEENEDIPF